MHLILDSEYLHGVVDVIHLRTYWHRRYNEWVIPFVRNKRRRGVNSEGTALYRGKYIKYINK